MENEQWKMNNTTLYGARRGHRNAEVGVVMHTVIPLMDNRGAGEHFVGAVREPPRHVWPHGDAPDAQNPPICRRWNIRLDCDFLRK